MCQNFQNFNKESLVKMMTRSKQANQTSKQAEQQASEVSSEERRRKRNQKQQISLKTPTKQTKQQTSEASLNNQFDPLPLDDESNLLSTNEVSLNNQFDPLSPDDSSDDSSDDELNTPQKKKRKRTQKQQINLKTPINNKKFKSLNSGKIQQNEPPNELLNRCLSNNKTNNLKECLPPNIAGLKKQNFELHLLKNDPKKFSEI